MRITQFRPQALPLALVLFLLPSCASLTIPHVDYSWPVENSLKVSQSNTVSEERYGITFGVSALAMEEFQDSTSLRGTTLRIIRSSEGYYFITGPRFKNVYVFEPGEQLLRLKNKLEVAPVGLKNPALNQRAPYIELMDENNFKLLLSSDQVIENAKQVGLKPDRSTLTTRRMEEAQK